MYINRSDTPGFSGNVYGKYYTQTQKTNQKNNQGGGAIGSPAITYDNPNNLPEAYLDYAPNVDLGDWGGGGGKGVVEE